MKRLKYIFLGLFVIFGLLTSCKKEDLFHPTTKQEGTPNYPKFKESLSITIDGGEFDNLTLSSDDTTQFKKGLMFFTTPRGSKVIESEFFAGKDAPLYFDFDFLSGYSDSIVEYDINWATFRIDLTMDSPNSKRYFFTKQEGTYTLSNVLFRSPFKYPDLYWPQYNAHFDGYFRNAEDSLDQTQYHIFGNFSIAAPNFGPNYG